MPLPATALPAHAPTYSPKPAPEIRLAPASAILHLNEHVPEPVLAHTPGFAPALALLSAIAPVYAPSPTHAHAFTLAPAL